MVRIKLWSLLIVLLSMRYSLGQPGKCDQNPVTGGRYDIWQEGPYHLEILTKGTEGKYMADQTYILILGTTNKTRPFRSFILSVEDPEVDNNVYNYQQKDGNVGILKIVGSSIYAQYSERCPNTVENTDNSDKEKVEVHWVSPRDSEGIEKIRFRATVAENRESWYEGDALTKVLEKDNSRAIDSPSLDPTPVCTLCSEARYEVIFTGIWSRGTHPNKFPSRPDDVSFSYMIGASHDYEYDLWKPGTRASRGLKLLAEDANITEIETDIITNMNRQANTKGTTRTLIKGKRRRHPHMAEPSHSLFRVDRNHHLFSILVAMRPSPDWFLGTSMFELCTKDGWLSHETIKLFPWDAGTMNGVSYDSPRSVTVPEDMVGRVAVGSFDRKSPFYQMNLIDLKPFATLEVRRLDVYPLTEAQCSQADGDGQGTENADGDNAESADGGADAQEEPMASEVLERLCLSDWTDWSACDPDNGFCGLGTRKRFRYVERKATDEYDGLRVRPLSDCSATEDTPRLDTEDCYLPC